MDMPDGGATYTDLMSYIYQDNLHLEGMERLLSNLDRSTQVAWNVLYALEDMRGFDDWFVLLPDFYKDLIFEQIRSNVRSVYKG
ncbi:hypothetical protein ROSI111154_24100 [Rouxiella silvae]